MSDVAYVIFVILVTPGALAFIWWAMWRENFDGIRSEFEYYRDVKKRPCLTPEEYYRQYYATSDIPRETVDRFMCMQTKFWQEPLETMRPEDDFFMIYAGADFTADWLVEVENEFRTDLSDDDRRDVTETSNDTLLRMVHRKITSN